MSASLKPLTLDEFLDWERSQEERYEFDGIQPVAMTGSSRPHSRIGTRLVVALAGAVQPPCEVIRSRPEGPDHGPCPLPRCQRRRAASRRMTTATSIAPTVVFEVISPSTALTDRRVKAIEYAAVPSILVYRRCWNRIGRRSPFGVVPLHGKQRPWQASRQSLELPEIGVRIAMSAIYDAA